MQGYTLMYQAFILFPIVIPCLKEPEAVFLKRKKWIFSIIADSTSFAFCYRQSIFTGKISNMLLQLVAKRRVL